MGNTLSVAVTAEVADLQAKFATAKAEVNALTKEMNALAKQSAAGVLDPAGLAQLQEVAHQFLEAKQAAKEFSEQIKGVHEESLGYGGAIKEMGANLNTAFEMTGAAVAIEAFHKLGEVIEDLGGRAVQIQSFSEILGVTAEEFQTMQRAAEEAGASTEMLARAAEHLKTILFEARDNSGAAVEKLKDLGVTTEQIADPTFKINDLLGVLHDRLNDASTEQQTMNALIKDFGSKAALAAETIKNYDGSLAGVKKSMGEVSGLTGEQVHHLAEVHAWWGKVGTAIKNAASEYALWVADIVSTANEVGEREKAARAPGADPNVAADAKADSRLKSAEKEIAAIQLVTKADLEADRDAIASTKQGTAERLAAVQQYALQAAVYYGSNVVDKVREANRQVISEARAANEELIREAARAENKAGQLRAEAIRATIKADDDTVKARLAGIKLTIDANQQYFDKAVKTAEFYHSVEMMNLELQTKIYTERTKTSAQLIKLTEKETKEQLAEWKFLTDGMRQGFASAMQGMLMGTESFSQAIRGMFTSVFDAIISQVAEWAAEWITQHLIALATSKATATDEAIAAAGVAGANAMASVAAIPFVGWAMAPEVGASTYAEALAIGLPKMDVGAWNLPRDMVVQAHKGESIVPTNFAEGMRQNGMQGGGAQRPRTQKLNIQYTPVGNGGMLMTRDSLTAMLKDLHYSFAVS